MKRLSDKSIRRLKQRIHNMMWRHEDIWYRTAAYQAIDAWVKAERKRKP
jgi:hypothetical protein